MTVIYHLAASAPSMLSCRTNPRAPTDTRLLTSPIFSLKKSDRDLSFFFTLHFKNSWHVSLTQKQKGEEIARLPEMPEENLTRGAGSPPTCNGPLSLKRQRVKEYRKKKKKL